MKFIFRAIFLSILVLYSHGSMAAKTYNINVAGLIDDVMEPSCSFLLSKFSANEDRYGEGSCVGFEQAYQSTLSTPAGNTNFSVVFKKGSRAGTYSANIAFRGGACKAGTPAGSVTLPLRYVNASGATVQTIRKPDEIMFSQSGCQVRGVSEESPCVGFVRGPVTILHCGVVMQETGNNGGPSSSPDDSEPAYTGGDGAGGGGGTTPGDGTGGGGDTGGGGTTPGGGGTGGGGTGGGTGGEGGSGDGSGNGNGNGGGGSSSGNKNCGAYDQPNCRIEEGGTPDGKNILDNLSLWLSRHQETVDDALKESKSDFLKDTSIPSVFNVPSGVCRDPVLDFAGGSRSIPICYAVGIASTMFELFWTLLFMLAIMSMVSRATKSN